MRRFSCRMTFPSCGSASAYRSEPQTCSPDAAKQEVKVRNVTRYSADKPKKHNHGQLSPNRQKDRYSRWLWTACENLFSQNALLHVVGIRLEAHSFPHDGFQFKVDHVGNLTTHTHTHTVFTNKKTLGSETRNWKELYWRETYLHAWMKFISKVARQMFIWKLYRHYLTVAIFSRL